MMRMRGDSGSGKFYVTAVVVGLLVTLGVVFAVVGIDWWYQDAPLNTFAPKGTNARAIQDLVDPVFVLGGVIFVAVEGVILYLAFHNRRKDGDDEIPTQNHGNVKLELGWTILPAVIIK